MPLEIPISALSLMLCLSAEKLREEEYYVSLSSLLPPHLSLYALMTRRRKGEMAKWRGEEMAAPMNLMYSYVSY